jgi:hypothetical protein
MIDVQGIAVSTIEIMKNPPVFAENKENSLKKFTQNLYQAYEIFKNDSIKTVAPPDPLRDTS